MYRFGGRVCAVPVVRGNYWVQTMGNPQRVIAVDVGNPRKPVQVSTVDFDARQWPHWLSADPTSDRIVMVNSQDATQEHRIWMLSLDSHTGRLTIDERFRSPGADKPGVSFADIRWPHGDTGDAIPHGTVRPLIMRWLIAFLMARRRESDVGRETPAVVLNVTRQVVFRPEAEDEVLEAFEWYEKRRAGLGKEFDPVVAISVCRVLPACWGGRRHSGGSRTATPVALAVAPVGSPYGGKVDTRSNTVSGLLRQPKRNVAASSVEPVRLRAIMKSARGEPIACTNFCGTPGRPARRQPRLQRRSCRRAADRPRQRRMFVLDGGDIELHRAGGRHTKGIRIHSCKYRWLRAPQLSVSVSQLLSHWSIVKRPIDHVRLPHGKRPARPTSYSGALPVIRVLVEISVRGSSTTFSPETFMPFLRSVTAAGLPSTTNRNVGGTTYSRFSPLASVRIT